MHIRKATKYLKDVTFKKQRVPFRRYNGGAAGCAQAKQRGWTQGRGPKKSAELLLHMRLFLCQYHAVSMTVAL